MRNLRLAFRTLGKTPIVTVVAALSLGLGIGSNAAIYSLFHQMLRQDLAVHAPEQLVNFSAPGPKNGSQSCSMAGPCEDVFSYPMLRDLQQSRQAAFSAIAGHSSFNTNVAYENRSFARNGLVVTGTYFPALRLQPALGRLLAPADDVTDGAHPVAVLSHRFWSRDLAGDSGVVGRTLMVNGQPLTILGVAPEGFDGTTFGYRPAFFVPITMARTLDAGMEGRRAYWIYLFGRLAPGKTIAEAGPEINAVYQPILGEIEAPLQNDMRDSALARFKAKSITLAPGHRGQSDIGGAAGATLAMLFGVTGFVLLIACANIANLLLARATNREMEMAVRLSLGATRRQLLGQLLTESVALALLGGVASLLFATWTLKGIGAMLPPQISEAMNLTVSWPAVAFAGALSLATGLAFGLFPALHSTRPDLVTALRNNSGKLAGGKGARRFRTALATGQIALAMALLMSAGLFLKSLWKVSQVDLGVRVEKLVTFSISPAQSGYDSVRSRALYERLEGELASLPGVTAVTSSLVPLIAGSSWGTSITVQGYRHPNGENANARFNSVGPGYFRTVGAELLAGREFTEADDLGRQRVAIVNETFARRFNLGANPVGKLMSTRTGDTVTLDTEIIGLVRDAKYAHVKDEIPPVFFTPRRQRGNVGSLNLYVRTAGDPLTLVRSIPGAVARLDPMLPVEGLKTMPEEIRQNTFLDRMISSLTAAFAVLATLLAAIGLYGVLAYSVAQRTREIGVRMALGAHAAQVRRLVMWQVGRMVIVGGIIGVAAAVALGQAARSILFGISGSDPAVMMLSVALLTAVALGAGYVPARRASRVDPMQALRYE